MLTDNVDVSRVNDREQFTDSEVGSANIIPSKMAELISKLVPFAKDRAKRLYWFNGSVYVPDGETAVAELYEKVLKVFSSNNWIDSWSKFRLSGILAYIINHAEYLLDKPELEKICLLNGVFDWATMTFSPSDPGYRTTIQIPINYDPDAKCLAWNDFLHDIFPEGVELLKEIMALCIIPLTSLQKCVVLVGEGNNGKGTYLKGLQSIVGYANCSNITLQRLTGAVDRFSTSALVDKLINVCGDLPQAKVDETANFKMITGEDRISIEYKGKQAFDYTPFARLIFSTNHIIRSDDDSDGFKRRFLNIPFTKRFNVDPVKSAEINAMFNNPVELSGMLNELLPLIPNLEQNGFTISSKVAELVDNYSPIPSDTYEWLKSNISYDPKGVIPSSAFYDFYCENCPYTPGNSLTRAKLVMYMKNTFPDLTIDSTRIFKGIGPIHSYLGVTLTNPETKTEVLTHCFKLNKDKPSNYKSIEIQ